VLSVKKLKYQYSCAAVVGIDVAAGDGEALGALLAPVDATADGVALGDVPFAGAGVIFGHGCVRSSGLSSCSREKINWNVLLWFS